MPVRPRVFVTRALPGEGLSRLSERARVEVWPGPGSPPPEALAEGARESEGLLCLLTDRVDAALLGACPGLRVVSSCSAGLDHIDLDAAKVVKQDKAPGHVHDFVVNDDWTRIHAAAHGKLVVWSLEG